MAKKHLLITLALSALLLLQGCAVSHLDSNQQIPKVPSNWFDKNSPAFNQQSIDENWLTVFTTANSSPELATLVQEALQSNQLIQKDSLAVDIAAQQLVSSKSDFWPELDLSLSGARSKSDSSISSAFSLEADLTYELDLWGAISDAERQAKLNYLIAQANLAEAILQLKGNVLLAYANASRAFQLVTLAEQQVKNSSDNLDIIERGYQAGLNESLDVYLARNELNSDISTLSQNRQTLVESKRILERLLGRYPTGNINVSEVLTLPDETLDVGIPSEVVTRKPALQAQWFALMAQDAALAIAHKARFPSFNISASIGPSSDSISNLFSASTGWSLLGSLSAPIFNAGRLKANEEIERLNLKSLEQTYLDSVLATLLTTENALTQELTLHKRYEATLKAKENAQIANQLAFEQYQAGLVSYTTVLDAQARLITSQTNLIDIQTNLITNRISLHVALGAGANFDANINNIE